MDGGLDKRETEFFARNTKSTMDKIVKTLVKYGMRQQQLFFWLIKEGRRQNEKKED